MKKLLASLALASTLLMAGGDVAPVELAPVEVITEAEKNGYVGLSTVIGITEGESINWFGLTSVGAQAGYVFYRAGDFSTAVEGRYATDTTDWFDTYTVSALIKPAYDVGGFDLYGLVGYQDGTGDLLSWDGELAYGLGAETDVFGYGLFVDYLYGNDTKSEIVTVGLNYRF